MVLSVNYPNPFNTLTTIQYQLFKDGLVQAEIVNLQGQSVATVVDAFQAAGVYHVQWNAGDLASGVYYCRLVQSFVGSQKTRSIHKMVLQK